MRNTDARLRWRPNLLALLIACTAVSCQHTSMERAWRPLFDGRDTKGWQMTGPGEVRLEEGELVTYGGMGLFWYTREKFGNCQIRVVYQPGKSSDNSGVFIRIPARPTDPWFAVNRGYEVQLANAGPGRQGTGTIYSLTTPKNPVESRLNEWNTMIITLDGPRTQVTVNGVLVTDFREGDPVPPKKNWHEPTRGPRPITGYIGLQNHDDESRVRFKEISVRKL